MKRLLVVLSVTAVMTLGACGGGDNDDASTGEATTTAPTPDPAATTSSPTPTPTPTATDEDPTAPAIDYDTEEDSGMVVSDPGSADSMPKASTDFKQFIGAELKRLQDEAGDDCTNKPQIRVSKLQTAGWASGGVFTPECGGYAVLWAKTGGEWSQVWGGQELVDCDTLREYRFPVSVAGTSCLGQNGSSFTYKG